MDETKALAEIKRLTSLRRVSLTKHARDRMSDRNVRARDIVSALTSATAARHEAGSKYRAEGGVDVDGDALTVVVVIESDLLVVTVF